MIFSMPKYSAKQYSAKQYSAKQSGRAALVMIFGAAAFSFGILIYFFVSAENRRANLDNLKHATHLFSTPRAFPDFTLADHRGNVFSNGNLKDNWSFIFFGFTHCPDVCPLTLSTIDKVMNNLSANEDISATGIFVSVDPKRDTQEKLSSYVQHFNQDMIGLSGNYEKLSALTQALGVVYTTPDMDEKENYVIDHSAHIFVVAPNGNLVALFGTPHEMNTITNDFKILHAYYNQQNNT